MRRMFLLLSLLVLHVLPLAGQLWSGVTLITTPDTLQQLILRSADGSAPRRIAVHNLLPRAVTGIAVSGTTMTVTRDNGSSFTVTLPERSAAELAVAIDSTLGSTAWRTGGGGGGGGLTLDQATDAAGNLLATLSEFSYTASSNTLAFTLADGDIPSTIARLANPTFTGNVVVPGPGAGTHAANKSYVDAEVGGAVNLIAAKADRTLVDNRAPDCADGQIRQRGSVLWGCIATPSGGGVSLSDAAPTRPTDNAGSAGTGNAASRGDHRHPLPALASRTSGGLMSHGDKQQVDKVGDLEHRTVDLTATAHDAWSNLPNGNAAAFKMVPFNGNIATASWGASHEATTTAGNYLVRLRIPLAESLAQYRLTVDGALVQPRLWSEDAPDATYRYFGPVGFPNIAQNKRVIMQRSTRTYHTTFAGDVPTPTRDAAPATKAYVDANAGGSGVETEYIVLGALQALNFSEQSVAEGDSAYSFVGGGLTGNGRHRQIAYSALNGEMLRWNVPSTGGRIGLADFGLLDNTARAAITGTRFWIANDGTGNVSVVKGGIAQIFPSNDVVIMPGGLVEVFLYMNDVGATFPSGGQVDMMVSPHDETETFAGLTDTPDRYSGQQDRLLFVNSGASGVTFRRLTPNGGLELSGGSLRVAEAAQDRLPKLANMTVNAGQRRWLPSSVVTDLAVVVADADQRARIIAGQAPTVAADAWAVTVHYTGRQNLIARRAISGTGPLNYSRVSVYSEPNDDPGTHVLGEANWVQYASDATYQYYSSFSTPSPLNRGTLDAIGTPGEVTVVQAQQRGGLVTTQFGGDLEWMNPVLGSESNANPNAPASELGVLMAVERLRRDLSARIPRAPATVLAWNDSRANGTDLVLPTNVADYRYVVGMTIRQGNSAQSWEIPTTALTGDTSLFTGAPFFLGAYTSSTRTFAVANNDRVLYADVR